MIIKVADIINSSFKSKADEESYYELDRRVVSAGDALLEVAKAMETSFPEEDILYVFQTAQAAKQGLLDYLNSIYEIELLINESTDPVIQSLMSAALQALYK